VRRPTNRALTARAPLLRAVVNAATDAVVVQGHVIIHVHQATEQMLCHSGRSRGDSFDPQADPLGSSLSRLVTRTVQVAP
jgi:hypothetical protein